MKSDENCMSAEMVAVYQEKTPAERLQIAFGMWRSAKKIIAAAVRQQHSDWTEEQQRAEVAKRMSHGAS